jgi:hypothetical protein
MDWINWIMWTSGATIGFCIGIFTAVGLVIVGMKSERNAPALAPPLDTVSRAARDSGRAEPLREGGNS